MSPLKVAAGIVLALVTLTLVAFLVEAVWQAVH